MRLHENWELFSDALQAASQPLEEGGLGIKSIFIEKDYWICRSLSLMAANDKDNRAIFKGGTSLTKAYGIGNRFSEDIDIAISEAWTLSGNQLKMLIKRTAKSMTEGLQEINMPGFTSKGSHYHKAYYSYPRALIHYRLVQSRLVNYLLKSTLLLIHIRSKNVNCKVF